jgi:outer membrane immunogenic protein
MLVLATMGLGGTAQAQGFLSYPSYPPPIDWRGLYLGGEGGVGWGSSRHTDATGFDSGSFDLSGGLIGGTAGYNWQTGPFVYGLEGDMSWADISGSTAGTEGLACGGFQCSTRLDDLGTVRARFGYSLGTILPYVTGGFAFGDVHGSESGTPGVSATGSGSSYRTGWTVGGGIEDAITPRWRAKIEYLHVDLGSGPVFTDTFSDGTTASEHVGFDADIIRIGLNYRFW